MDSANQLNLLKERIKFSENVFGDYQTYTNSLSRLLEDSKFVALSIRYPYKDFSTIELPKKYYNWQIRCCEEIYREIGTQGIKSYSENGLSWTRDSAYLPNELRNEIESVVGYITGDDE